MDLFDAIRERHSYRGEFSAKAVPREDIRKILEAGIRAPSGFNAQTTEFVVVDDAKTLRRLADIVSTTTTESASAIIVCLMKTDEERNGLFFGIEDYAAAVENMLLAVTALGYATVWIDGALRRENRAQAIAELLGVPANREVRVILPVGVPAETGQQREKKPFDQRAWFNRYGSG
jgi:nitroreductase